MHRRASRVVWPGPSPQRETAAAAAMAEEGARLGTSLAAQRRQLEDCRRETAALQQVPRLVNVRAVLRGRDFFPVKDRALRTTPQLGISGMKSARIRNDCQKISPRLRRRVPFFPTKSLGTGYIFYL